jgi:hypothetical protein
MFAKQLDKIDPRLCDNDATAKEGQVLFVVIGSLWDSPDHAECNFFVVDDIKVELSAALELGTDDDTKSGF